MKRKGYFGKYGGRFIAETLMPAVEELERAFMKLKKDPQFNRELQILYHDYAGRPTPLSFCPQLSRQVDCRVYLKREDLAHTGAHKINNALGQALLAKKIKKSRIIAETGAGQHGVAAATAAARLGLKCEVYMGEVDMERQQPNVFRMKLLGAKVIPVKSGSRTLKDAINETLRDWTSSMEDTHYLLGSVLGPHPYPEMVAHFQSIIGQETREQILATENRLPRAIIACVGGGSNAIGIFREFINDRQVKLIGVEAGGLGLSSGKHAARFADRNRGRPGIIHGTLTYVLQDAYGQIFNTHSVSAGLDYCAVGPEHTYLRETGRAQYTYVTDQQCLEAFQLLSQTEGIIPALESAHAVAYLIQEAAQFSSDDIVIINMSGRGDKDIYQAAKHLGVEI